MRASAFLGGLIAFFISTISAYAGYLIITNSAAPAPPLTAQGYFSPTGHDSATNIIGTDCTYAAPCKTLETKMLAFVKANVVAHPNMIIGLDPFHGPFFPQSPIIWTPDQTGSGQVLLESYNPATNAEISAGTDMAGTWVTAGASGSQTLPSTTAACASNLLVSQAPLTVLNRDLYFGKTRINGHWIPEPSNPRRGNAWAQVTGTSGGAAVGSSVFTGPTLNITTGTGAIAVTDTNSIGVGNPPTSRNPYGQPIKIESACGNLAANKEYWIGAGSTQSSITLLNEPGTLGGSVITRSAACAGVHVQDPMQSSNPSDNLNLAGQNRFPYPSPGASPYIGSWNSGNVIGQRDVAIEMAYPVSISRIATVNNSTFVATMDSRPFHVGGESGNIYPKQGYRVLNNINDLGTGGYTGEGYLDRLTGWYYYVPRSGETCSSINAAGVSYAPGYMETMLKISNATADYSGTTGQNVGNVKFKYVTFEDTNSSALSGNPNMDGAVGGAEQSETVNYIGPYDYAVALIGASGVIFDTDLFHNLSGSGLGIGWGSNNNQVTNSSFRYIGGIAITTGGFVQQMDAFHYQTDPTIYGTGAFGPTTSSFSTSGGATNVDFTNANDCCQTITNNTIHDAALLGVSTCVGFTGWNQDLFSQNTVYNCPGMGVTMGAQAINNQSPPGYGLPLVTSWIHSATTYYPVWGNTLTWNHIYQAPGWETTLADNVSQPVGVATPGFSGSYDVGGLYGRGPQDYDGTGAKAGTLIEHNWIANATGGCFPQVKANGGTSTVFTGGQDGQLIYLDGNNFTADVHSNLLVDQSSTALGQTVCPVRGTQLTGMQRSRFWNNILSMQLPSGYSTGNPDGSSYFQPRNDVAMQNYVYRAGMGISTNQYILNAKNVYQALGSGTAGTTGPTCGSGSCTDSAGINYNFIAKQPTGMFGSIGGLEYSNLVQWYVAGSSAGAASDAPFVSGGNGIIDSVNGTYYQFGGTGQANMYTAGSPTNIETVGNVGGGVSFATWQGFTGIQGQTQDIGAMHGTSSSPDSTTLFPNFVNQDSDWHFKSSYSGGGTSATCSTADGGASSQVSPACNSTVNFVPWEYTNAGAGGTGGGDNEFYNSFPLVENPISIGGAVVTANSAGVNWNPFMSVGACSCKSIAVVSVPSAGLADSNVNNSAIGDALAVLTGTWAPDQYVTLTVGSGPATGGGELEIHLRTDPATSLGYELDFAFDPTQSYAELVSWDGIGNGTTTNGNHSYSVLASGGDGTILHTGDVIRGEIVGSTITMYRNNKVLLTFTDSRPGKFTTGNPGFGMNEGGSSSGAYGISKVTAGPP